MENREGGRGLAHGDEFLSPLLSMTTGQPTALPANFDSHPYSEMDNSTRFVP